MGKYYAIDLKRALNDAEGFMCDTIDILENLKTEVENISNDEDIETIKKHIIAKLEDALYNLY